MPKTDDHHESVDDHDDRRHDIADGIIDDLAPLLAQHRRKWAERCQAAGVSIIGFHVLALLEMRGSLPMSHLADELGVALPNATGIIGRLEERGLVGRSHDRSDRRKVLVDLAADGRRLIGEMEGERRERIRRLIGALDADQQSRLAQSIRDLRSAAVAYSDSDTTKEAPSR